MSTQTEQKSPAQSALDWVVGRVWGHVGAAEDRWRTLHFTERGGARLAATVGWIDAHRRYDHPLAEALAEGLDAHFTRLSRWGGTKQVGDFEFPACRVIVSDDGSFNGFGLMWCYASSTPEGAHPDLTLDRWKDGGVTRCYYQRATVGALIYRGPTVVAPDATTEPWMMWTQHT